jgi:TctA family transporter
VASMYIGNIILLMLNLPLVGIFVNLLRIPYQWLVTAILVISIIAVYSVNSSVIDIWIMVVSGGIGYLLRKLGYEMAPLSLTMSGGSYATFLDTASVVVLGSVLGLLLIIQGLAWVFGYRKSIGDEAERA